jgi:hypothetical protein
VSNAITGALTLRLPESHKEEIEAIAARMDMPRPPYFARLDACSTKGGKGGVGKSFQGLRTESHIETKV